VTNLFHQLISKLKPHNSLRRDLLVALFLSLLTVFAFIIFVTTYYFYVTEQQTWHSRQRDALLVSESTIDSFLKHINDSMILAASVDKDYIRSNPDFVSEFLLQQSALEEVIFVDQEGEIYGSASRDEPVLSNLFTISQSGWFTTAIQGGTYTSRVQFSSLNNPYLIISVPSKYGVVAARLRLSVLRDVVINVRLGSTGNVYVIDRDGELIAHSNADLLNEGELFLNRPEVQAALNQGKAGWLGSYTNFDGERVLGETTSVFNDNWIVFVEIAREEAFANTRRAFALMFLGAALTFVVAMWVGNFLLVRYVFAPVNILRHGTIRIGEGDLDYRITFTRHDEIAMVGEAFNEMARNLRLREIALGDALKQAVDANRFKSQMLAHVSHDLRTPLGGIIGFSEILKEEVDGPLNDEQKETAAGILANGNRLLNMVNTLLDQAQLERGTFTLVNNTFDYRKLLEPLHVAHSVMAKSKDLYLEIEAKSDVPTILYGDLLRLQEILGNLVENALKFTRKGGVKVTLFCPDTEHWAVEVADTGAGIPLDAQEYIFEPFRQVDDSVTRKHGGVGLGLSIVKQLVDLMEGDISVQSEVGKGSKFLVILPLQKKEIK
jgi:signal transduction histidine kinase